MQADIPIHLIQTAPTMKESYNMKLTKQRLKEIIKEELSSLREVNYPGLGEIDEKLLALVGKEDDLPVAGFGGPDVRQGLERAFLALVRKYNKWDPKEVLAAAIVQGKIEYEEEHYLTLLIDPEAAKEDRAMNRRLPGGERPGPGMGKYGEARNYIIALFKSYGDMEAASVADKLGWSSFGPILQRTREKMMTDAGILKDKVGDPRRGHLIVIPGTEALPDGGEFLNYLASPHRSAQQEPVFMKNREKDAGYKIVDEEEWMDSQRGKEKEEWKQQEDFFGQGKEIGEGTIR